MAAAFPRFTLTSVRRALSDLERAGLLERKDRPRGGASDPAVAWGSWHPVASTFHDATRDLRFNQGARRGGGPTKRPSFIKRYWGAPWSALAEPPSTGSLPETLLARRTWRRFGAGSVHVDELATVLGLTFRIQEWMRPEGEGPVPLKTSPSGGARHPIEAYVLALRVRGLPRGLYHYAADRHGLERVRPGATRRDVRRYLPAQPWYEGAAVVVLLTSVFERVRWRYAHPRAYRGILVEAGHLVQTLLLLATWRGLAPFCTLALGDSAIERDLGLDGAREGAVYACGFGTRPAGVSRGQAPDEGVEGRLDVES